MASATVLGNHVVRRLSGATGSDCNSAHALTLLTANADLANRLKTLGNGRFVDGHGLSVNCPQGQYGNRYRQKFFDQVHLYTLIVASQARGHGFRGRQEYNGSAAAPKQFTMSQAGLPHARHLFEAIDALAHYYHARAALN